MSDYKFNRNEYGDILGCGSCQSEVPTSVYKRPPPNSDDTVLLCEICATSFIGNHYLYEHNRDAFKITQTIAQIGNIIRNDLGSFEEAETDIIKDNT